MQKVLQVNSLVKDYAFFRAVDSVNFHINEGEIFGLLGLNGAGKTSIISCIVGLSKISSGKIQVFGKDVEKFPLFTKSQIGFVPQELIHHGYFNVIDIVRFYSGYYGKIRNEEKISSILKDLSLWDVRHKKVKELSGGMKRRVLIAKALSIEPRLVILDEPTAGLDIELTQSLWKLFRRLKKEGLSILLTTHYLREAEKLCDRVLILNKGKVQEEGKTREVIRKLTSRKLFIEFKGKKKMNLPYLSSFNDGLHKINLPYSFSVGEFLSKIDLTKVSYLSMKEGSLEEAFHEALGSHEF